MDFPGARSGTRRTEALNRIVRLGRRSRAEDAPPAGAGDGHEKRIRALELRVDHLEALLEGLQDAVHRGSVRQDARIEKLERKTEPAAMSRSLSRDARERGV